MPNPAPRPPGRSREADRADERVSLARKVAFLSQPESFPERTDTVEVIETRHSWVFLTAHRAWKLKKPEHSEYFDFTHVDARHHDCIEEVRLNAPLAPDVYQGVVTLERRPDGNLSLGDGGAVVDHLVCMRRLPDAACMEVRISRGAPLARTMVDRAAARLASFYHEAPDAGPVDVQAMREAVTAEASALRALPLPAPGESDRLRDGLLYWIDRHAERLAPRRRIEVHGDLRPQHIYLTDPPVFIDRLTFAPELRLLDAVEELAFLALECERLGAGWIGERFLAMSALTTGDTPPPELVSFYRARRGLLWAMLSGRHLVKGGRDERPWAEIATAYRRLALAWLRMA